MKHNFTAAQLHGVYVPLVTPIFKDAFDAESMRTLVTHLEKSVDGFVPCLSTGEGNKMTDSMWMEVVSCVRKQTAKPVFAGIKRTNSTDIIHLGKEAQKIGCDAIIISTIEENALNYITNIANVVPLPIIQQ